MTEIKKDKKYLSWSSGFKTLDDNRKWSDDNGIVVKLDKNGYLSSEDVATGFTYYLSWSSGYEQLDDNRKWAVWQKTIPEITVQFKN